MDSCAFSIIVDSVETNVCIKKYSNYLFVIITQFEKLGSIISVSKERGPLSCQINEATESFAIKTIFGNENIETNVAARFIAEHIQIEEPMLLSICLKNYEPKTLKAIVKAINQEKIW